MSVIAVSPDLLEVTTLVLQPSQSFSSSSSGMLGQISFYSKPSSAFRSIYDVTSGSACSDNLGITVDNDLLFSASEAYLAGDNDVSDFVSGYLYNVTNATRESQQYSKTFPVRFTSQNSFMAPDTTTGEQIPEVDRNEWYAFQRRVARNCLIPDQRVENPLSFYAYTNYHCLSFVSSSNFGTGSAIIYPNFQDASGIRQYTPDREFTLDFFVKPKAPLDETEHYRAGTIFHLSSSICVSLVSGSSIGPDRKPDTYRILLQLSQSADISPSSVDLSSLPLSSPNLIFASDESLKRDTWHRVTIKWGGERRSFGSGSISIDDRSITRFNANYPYISTGLSSDAIVIGNYYNSGDRIAKFFNSLSASFYGTLVDPVAGTSDPSGFEFNHALNAEIHHLSLFKRVLSQGEISSINNLYPTASDLGGPCFFLPPFFTSSIGTAVNTYVSPNYIDDVETDSPVSYFLALGYNANYINLQNFLVDFSTKNIPRAYGLSEVPEITTTFDSRTDSIDDLLMSNVSTRKRNFTVLPCDDGQFDPRFDVLESDYTSRFQNIGTTRSTSLISLEALAKPGFFPTGKFLLLTSFGDGLSYDGSDAASGLLPWYQDANYFTNSPGLPDNSCNLPIVFSIPSLYYMTRIVPGSFVITDASVSGSGGMSFTLRDDGRGNLYRSDTNSAPAKWNRVGALFYNHGIAIVLSPHLPFFGKSSYEMTFRGETRKSVATYSIPAKPDIANYSFNPTHTDFPPSQLGSEAADSFSYITGINLHDENLNVVMRAKLAQPIQKREGDEITFRLRYDF